MLGRKVVQYTDDPFPIGVVEPALASFDSFRFPDLRHFTDVTQEYPGNWAKKLHLWSRHPHFLDVIRGTPWENFWNWLNSPAFAQHCQGIFRPFGIEVEGEGALMQFSSLPADGGWIHPHTDMAEKVLSIVIFIDGFPAPFKAHKGEKTYEFPVAPNRYIFFQRSERSWHSVGPFFSKTGENRNTVNINLLAKAIR